MKYIIETSKLCRERGTIISEVMDKMYAIEDNINHISTELEGEIETIEVDLSVANDEFYITNRTGGVLHIEVVTRGMAVANDLDFVNTTQGYTQEEVDSYEVGGTLSVYEKLGDSDFFFKEM